MIVIRLNVKILPTEQQTLTEMVVLGMILTQETVVDMMMKTLYQMKCVVHVVEEQIM